MIINQPPTLRACYFCDNSDYFIVQWHIKCGSYFKQKMLFIPPPKHIYMHIDVIYDRARLLCGYIEMGYVMKCGVYSWSIYYVLESWEP